ncbi:MAG: hypothetical protein WCK35_04685 [Chloroflexota bacterium]
MSNHSTHSPRFPLLRRLWKPVAVTGAGGTAIAYWFEKIVMFGEEILALIFLPLLAGVIYLLDILIFKSRMPRREDMTQNKYREQQDIPVDIGAKK